MFSETIILISKKQVPPHLKRCGLRQALVFRMLRNENSNRYYYILKDVVFISDIIKQIQISMKNKTLLTLLISSSLIFPFNALTQSKEPTTSAVSQETQLKQQQVSYKLEDLCDTEIKERGITLKVYIQESEKLWDYHLYKDELFNYVKEFFKKQEINCDIIYSNSKLNPFNSPNEFGIEVLESDGAIINRFFELFTPRNEEEREEKLKKLQNNKGYAATQKGIALINGGWEEFRDFMTRKEVEEQFSEKYEGMTIKEYILRTNAGNICHEVLHCLGLSHPDKSSRENKAPDIMSYYPAKFSKENIIGYTLAPLQIKLIHSFISGNNTYRAFLDSRKDIEIFVINLERAGK